MQRSLIKAEKKLGNEFIVEITGVKKKAELLPVPPNKLLIALFMISFQPSPASVFCSSR